MEQQLSDLPQLKEMCPKKKNIRTVRKPGIALPIRSFTSGQSIRHAQFSSMVRKPEAIPEDTSPSRSISQIILTKEIMSWMSMSVMIQIHPSTPAANRPFIRRECGTPPRAASGRASGWKRCPSITSSRCDWPPMPMPAFWT